MNKNKFLLPAAIVVATAAVNTAIAKDGFSIGTITSNATLSHTIERDTGSNTTPSITSNTEESDIAFGLTAGYQFHISEQIFLGAELFYQEQNIETSNLNNLLRTELELNETYGVKVKAGLDINDQFSVYGLIGSTTLDFDIRNSYPFAPPMREGNESINEITFGLGAQYNISDNWSVVAEFSQLNDAGFDPLPEVAVPGKINPNELDYSQLSIGVNFNF